jgi:hypothetical protein
VHSGRNLIVAGVRHIHQRHHRTIWGHLDVVGETAAGAATEACSLILGKPGAATRILCTTKLAKEAFAIASLDCMKETKAEGTEK